MDNTPIPATSYIDRVIGSDATRKGVVALATGVLFAVIREAVWPSR